MKMQNFSTVKQKFLTSKITIMVVVIALVAPISLYSWNNPKVYAKASFGYSFTKKQNSRVGHYCNMMDGIETRV